MAAKTTQHSSKSNDLISLTDQFSTHNYSPLDVVIAGGEGCWVEDVDGQRYLDMLSAYSALNFGHRHPRLVAAAKVQLDRLTMTSRAFYHDLLGPFCQNFAAMTGLDLVLPMNTGAEAVETAIKAARRWGYEVKGIPDGSAEIICFDGNFHGRTTTIISFSTSDESRSHFGPLTPGFCIAPFGDLAAVERLITPRTVAVLVEPIQGEGGVIIPPPGFLRGLRQLADAHQFLLIADEVQTGLGRTGRIWACDHESVTPDLITVAKSLGGGIVPISAVAGKRAVMEVFTPGSHGSTFGGNSLACAVALEVMALIRETKPEEHSAKLGTVFLKALQAMPLSQKVSEIRGRGLFIGVDIRPEFGPAKAFCKALRKEGLLCKDTRSQTIRFAPPLIITEADLRWALERIERVLGDTRTSGSY